MTGEQRGFLESVKASINPMTDEQLAEVAAHVKRVVEGESSKASRQEPNTPRRMRLLEEWNSFRREVIPAGAPEMQVQECHRAFYAGAAASFNIYGSIGSDEVSEEEGLATLLHLSNELEKFNADVKAGLA